MLAVVVGNVLSLIVLLTIWLAGRGAKERRWAWIIGSANQLAWVWYCIWLVPQPQILLLEGGLLATYLWNIWKGK